ncbi:MAG: Asp-tRNA(Asn)/Glu-tRNA(Gln) amidotransferase subunit GatB [Acidobacteria bacterium]|nr:Asp-tRNA(Asn)/Glu-tRNA(Gln) amidotransferase subunit GatB [Acidobacteriota bacterium]
MELEPVIGLEIHAQLQTATKIFCGCPARFGETANHDVCPVCLGMPGALPVLNGQAVDLAIAAALAFGCTVHETSVFARKNYFYPDLPKGYQISQYERPIATGGHVTIQVDGGTRAIRLTRIHMEEDAGKSVHEGFADSDRRTYLDYNRAGVPLIEIVSEPELRTPTEAAHYFESVRRLLVWIGANDGNMEEGSLRCDANVSVRPRGVTTLGTKVEVKNLNSFRYLQKALEYEIARQTDCVLHGERIVQETRLFDSALGRTFSMRSKEEAHDYRYFPEPDLPPVVVSDARRARVAATMPELPDDRGARFVRDYRLPDYDAGVLTESRGLADYFEKVAAACGNPKAASNWVMGEVLRVLKARETTIAEVGVTAEALGALIRLIDGGTISTTVAKGVFEQMYGTGQDASAIVEAQGLAQVSDDGALHTIVQQVVNAQADAVAQYRAGKKATFGFLVGEAMRASGGKADPKRLTQLLRATLDA